MRKFENIKAHRLFDGRDGGAWTVPSPEDGVNMAIIASNGAGWDHVSVSRPDRIPTWTEMDHVKRLFFMRSEAVIQIHPPESAHINIHKNCLHLWRPQGKRVPMPPEYMV